MTHVHKCRLLLQRTQFPRFFGTSAAFRSQKTLSNRVDIVGVGLHSGQDVNLTLKPANVNAGITFQRTDIQNAPAIPATFTNVSGTKYCTVLGRKGSQIETIEHLLAAFYTLGVSNCEVLLNGPDVPCLDGSAKPFCEKILETGLKDQQAPRKRLAVKRPVTVKSTKNKAQASLVPSESFRLSVEVDFSSRNLGFGPSRFTLDPNRALEEVIPARTFGFAEDVAMLHQTGLARGGSLDNSVVFRNGKPLNPEGLRYPDEWVRHKVLDALGDLSLAGPFDLCAHYEAIWPGHEINNKLLHELFLSQDNYEIISE
eukprot:GILJ01008558.1.p1 GENE.GILJ01008558.1~~GILJ01008558.1.p1  ORF type:complete len:313 (-),score=34.30 GILJ01008558.1:92-1030(-)